MSDKIDIQVTVPLDELVKVIKMIFAFGNLLDDIDASISNEALAAACDRANSIYGDEVDMLERVPLITQFTEAYFGIEMEDD